MEMACDIDETVRKSYLVNYKKKPLGYILDIDPKDIKKYDILCAGAPCQPFSNIGKRKGFGDDRGNLFFQLMKFVKYNVPKIVIFENVRGIVNHDKGKTLERILNEFKKAKYNTTHRVLLCSDYGIPQLRKRLFIIAVHESVEFKKKYKIDDLFDLNKYKKDIKLSTYLNKKFKRDYALTLRVGGRISPINDRHNWDGYYLDDGSVHRLTIEEGKLLQGFDEDFYLEGSLSKQWKQIGNTIPTIFTTLIGKNIKKMINLAK